VLHSPLAVTGTLIALLFLFTEIARYALAIAAAPTAPDAWGIVLAGLAVICAQALPRLAPAIVQRLAGRRQRSDQDELPPASDPDQPL
jgi:hypothetical protein